MIARRSFDSGAAGAEPQHMFSVLCFAKLEVWTDRYELLMEDLNFFSLDGVIRRGENGLYYDFQ